MPGRAMWFSCSRFATGRKKMSSLELFIKVYAKYIDCMRVKNSRFAGPCSAGPIPEAFQPPNGKSTAALAVEQLILRIPARARILKINCSTANAAVDLPFGGWKASGIGPAEHGPANREFFTRMQSIYLA